MRKLVLIPLLLFLTACKTTLIPDPVAFQPAAVLMEPPGKNKIIEKPAEKKAEEPK